MPDADMEMVGDAIMGSVFGSAGERCMAISVVVAVGDDTGAGFIEKLALSLVLHFIMISLTLILKGRCVFFGYHWSQYPKKRVLLG
jgi:hypothetical protein